MTDPKIIELLHEILIDVREVQRVTSRLVESHQERVILMHDMLAETKERNTNLQKLVDHVFDEDDEWWKKGEQPPWN